MSIKFQVASVLEELTVLENLHLARRVQVRQSRWTPASGSDARCRGAD